MAFLERWGQVATVTMRDRLVHAIGEVPVASARRAKWVLAAYLVASGVMAYGAAQVEYESNLLDILPRGDPHTEAAQNVSEAFPMNYYVTSIHLVADPGKCERLSAERLPNRITPKDCGNITDEVYVRSVEELNHYMLRTAPSVRYNITMDSYVRLINWSNSGSCLYAELGLCAWAPDDAAFERLPPTTPDGELQYFLAWNTFDQLSHQSLEAISGPTWNTTRNVYLSVSGDRSTADIGREVMDAWEGYRAWAPENAEWDALDLDVSRIAAHDPIVIDAHTTATTRHDVQRLLPFVVGFLVVTLYVAFRNLRSIAVAAGALGLGALSSFGVMGFMGVPLNALDVLLVPLILGAGIDYSIHVINEYLGERSRGLDGEAAWRAMGHNAGVPLLITATTTVGGLAVMALSPSLIMAQVGIISAVGMASIYLLAITFIPAALHLLGTEGLAAKFRPSRAMRGLGRAVARHPGAALAVVILLTAVSAVGSTRVPVESYGNPALDYPRGDPLRENYRMENIYFHGAEDPDEEWAINWLVFEGDMTDPRFHQYLRALEERLETLDIVRPNSIVSTYYVIEQWQILKGGTLGAAVPYLQETTEKGSAYPQTQTDIERVLGEIFASPFSTYGSLFMDPDGYDISLMLVEIKQGDDFATVEKVWEELWDNIDEVGREAGKPDDVGVHLYGLTATSYLFVEKELPWLQYMAAAGFALVTALVFFFTRDWRPTLTVALLMAITSLWWLALLPFFHIGLSIMLVLPMMFILSIGSDYAVILSWNMRETTGSEVFASTGKAILFSALTTAGAFVIFIGMTYLMMSRAMIATTLAVGAIFVATFLVVPLLYRRRILEGEAS